MKNAINYYYDFYVENVMHSNNNYFFLYNDNHYCLYYYDKEINNLKNTIYIEDLIKNNYFYSHKILRNKFNGIITYINNKNYILLELLDFEIKNIDFNDIIYFQGSSRFIKDKIHIDYIDLWSKKNDYYEYQINQFFGKYRLVDESIYYYLGLSENAISFISYNNIDDIPTSICHRRIDLKKSNYSFYNPVEYIIDYRIRDFSEFIKYKFFYDYIDMDITIKYIDILNLNNNELLLLFSRLLFPSYYFDLVDEIINNDVDERKILKIIEKKEEYEKYLFLFMEYLKNKKNLLFDKVEWLKSKY